jgi:hypothetical protein
MNKCNSSTVAGEQNIIHSDIVGEHMRTTDQQNEVTSTHYIQQQWTPMEPLGALQEPD